MKERFHEFDYFRGLAISFIVLGHSTSFALPGFPDLMENLLKGGTGLFVFISGFFYHRVFHSRIGYRDFLKKKLLALAVPLLVFTLIGLIGKSYIWMDRGESVDTMIKYVGYNLANFHVLYPHWYIPFILITFTCAPLHSAYIRLSPAWQLGLLIVFSAISMVLHRPHGNSNMLQNLIYFTPYYLMGILCSLYHQEMLARRKLIAGVSFFVMMYTLLGQTYGSIHIGNYHKDFFDWEGFDLQFLQTLAACLFYLELCRLIKWPWLKAHMHWLAVLSFPIFFIHPLFTMVLENAAYSPYKAWCMDLIKEYGQVANQFNFVLSSIIQLYGSAFVAMGLKRLLKEKSHWVIGR